MRIKPDQIINGFDSSYYLLTQPDVAATGVDPLAHFQAYGRNEGRMPNGVFDPAFYLAQNPDVAAAGINPLQHYLAFGAQEGRDPSASFDTSAYLSANPDVAIAGVNPLIHFLTFGAFDGRSGGANPTKGTSGNDFLIGTSAGETINAGGGNDFVIAAGGADTVDGGAGTDTVRFQGNFLDYTITFNGDQVIVDGPEGHDVYTAFERFSFKDVAFDNRMTSFFDEFFYYANNKDVYAAGMDAAGHYAAYGWKEGRDPNAFFDTSYYLSQNADVATAGVNPLEHYLRYGATEGRNPSTEFDTAAYLFANPDVAASGMNPLLHYLLYGRVEGRSAEGTAQTTVTSVTTLEDNDHIFSASDFDFGDLASATSVTIDASGITNGTLFLDADDGGDIDGSEALAGTGNVVTMADIVAGRLIFRPADDANGNAYGTFGYVGTDASSESTPGVMTINITPINDEPGFGLSNTTASSTEDAGAQSVTNFLTSISKGAANESGQAVSFVVSTNNPSLFAVAPAIDATGRLTYTAAANASGVATVTVSALDDGGTAIGGDDTSPSQVFTIDVSAVNDAPVLDASKSPVLAAVLEDAGAPSGAVGTLVSSLVDLSSPSGQVDNVTDVDASPSLGVAVTATSTTSGTWWYSVNGGTSWVAVGSVDASQSLLLTPTSRLYFQPNADFSGSISSAITFRAWDQSDSGTAGSKVPTTANGGTSAFSSSTDTASIIVTAVNDAPAGADKTVTISEDGVHSFTAADFGFTDPLDSLANALAVVRITTVPVDGSLTLDGVTVQAGDVVAVADIGLLGFRPAANENGTGYASFTFQVQDNGGTVNSGVNLDQTANTITIDVTPVNDAPSGTNNTVSTDEDTPYMFTASHFGFADATDGDSLASVRVTTLPATGVLRLDGTPVTEGQLVSVADLNDGYLVFTPAANASGTGNASFTFQVQDDGGTANGGVALDPSANTMTIDVTAVNDAPVLSAAATPVLAAVLEDAVTPVGAVGTLVSSLVNLNPPAGGLDNVTDADSSPVTGIALTGAANADGNWFYSTDNGASWSAVGVVENTSALLLTTDANTRLYFQPNANFNADFNLTVPIYFRAWDQSSGTAGAIVSTVINGGTTPYSSASDTVYIEVTPVNDAPVGSDGSVTIDEDTQHTFAASEFGFSDPTDDNAHTLASIIIKSLPVNGVLELVIDGVSELVEVDDEIAVVDIPSLTFTPTLDTNGVSQFSYLVRDNGGTANGGVDLDTNLLNMNIEVTAVNDAPKNITFTQAVDGNLDVIPVLEGSTASSTVIGTVTATDIEGDNPVSYSIVGSTPFAIDPVTGEITVATTDPLAIDYEDPDDAHSYELTVRVTDFLGEAREEVIRIAIGDVEPESSGSFQDGYIAGATLFVDENGDGDYDPGEYSTTTDAVGGFKIVGVQTGTLYMTGGIDTSTGLAFDGLMRAPSGSTVVTPITTLIVALIEAAAAELPPRTLTVQQASEKVAAALGLNPAIDYGSFDPIVAAISGATPQEKAAGEAAFAAGVQVYNTIVQASSLLTGAGSSGAAAAVTTAVATQLETAADASQTVSLSNQNALESVINGAAANAPPSSALDPATITGAANVMSAGNGVITQAVQGGATGTDLLIAVVGAGAVAQGGASTALAAAGASNDSGAAVTGFTGANLNTAVDTATTTAANNVQEILGPNGDNNLTGTAGADTLDSAAGNDNIFAGGGKDVLIGGSGADNLYGDTLDANDLINRSMGVDRADYSGAVGRINVALAAGTVDEYAADGTTLLSTDTLRSIEFVTGSSVADTFTAAGFSATSLNNGGVGYTFATGLGGMGDINQFEGKGGNDFITGNGATRLSYQSATAGVTVNLATGTATSTAGGDAAGIGTDTLQFNAVVGYHGVAAIRGSQHADTFIGRNNPGGTTENFDGLGGDDSINGANGFDRVRYDFENTGALGINVQLAAGIVTGRDDAATAVVGTDTLLSIEGVRGSNAADIYNAVGFTGAIGAGQSTNNGGDQGNFNEFEGMAGNDQITGNGNTRITYYNATAGVTAVFTAFGVGTVTGDASVGTDTMLGGINLFRGSNYGDTITGYNNGTTNFEQFEGFGGDDWIDGGAGLDQARYDANNGASAGSPLGANGMEFLMASGIARAIDGSGSAAWFNYGEDTLRSIESIRGTNSIDIYNAVGLTTSSTNAASYHGPLDLAAFNQFEGHGGNDEVTGNGMTRVNYQNANLTNSGNGSGLIITLKNGVTDGFATGRLNNTNTMTTNGSVGIDLLKDGINAVRGSNGNDIITGSDNTANPNSVEYFEGMGGNDRIDGLAGYDVVRYDNHNTGGIGLNIVRDGTGTTVTRKSPGGSDGVGTDTLFNIEGARGTNFIDTYNATGFIGFNDFEGMGGNDDITGNGQTRISYQNTANGNVNIDLEAGSVNGFAGLDTLHGGINAARGTFFGDFIRGTNRTVDWSGNDTLTGYGGSDTFRYEGENFGNDVITDFQTGLGSDDVILFKQSVFADYEALMAATADSGANTVITLGAHSITLNNVHKADLHFQDFHFIP